MNSLKELTIRSVYLTFQQAKKWNFLKGKYKFENSY